MNKFLILALFAFVAACSAAPMDTTASLEPVEAAEGVEGSEHEKRAIFLTTPSGYRYLPEYQYRYGYPPYYRYGYPSVPSLTYPYNNYPYRYLL